MTSEELENKMAYFTGTENYWHSPLMTMKYTDGVRGFAQYAGAGWLIADICAYKEKAKAKRPDEYMFSVKLIVKDDNTADLIFKDCDDKVVYTHHYNFTDCPAGDWLFFYYPIEDLLIWHGEY